MLQDKLGIDNKDVKILTMTMRDPEVSQQDLADALKLSQPSINVRLRKLKDSGILATTVGIDAHKAGLAMARVDFTCADADKMLLILKHCSFFVNGYLMSGTRNVSIFLIGEDLAKIEHIVKKYLRVNQQVSNIEVSVIVNTAKEFVCAVDLEKEQTHPCMDPTTCKECTIMHDLHHPNIKIDGNTKEKN